MGRRQVKRKKEIATNGEDRISNLPNNLLTHILSYLSTKDAVKTSILSKSWNPLWASIPVLEFNDCDFLPKGDSLTHRTSRKANFSSFMFRFLIRNDPPSTRKLHLRGSQCYDRSLLDSWIQLFKKQEVQELELEIYFYQNGGPMLLSVESRILLLLSISCLNHHQHQQLETNTSSFGKLCLTTEAYYDDSVLEPWSFVAKECNIEELELDFSSAEEEFDDYTPTRAFPKSWFTWETLRVLKLQGYKMMLDFPLTSVSFPKLKVIQFYKIIFKDNNTVSNLINLSCPILEELDINRYDEDNLHSLVITSNTLKRLRVIYLPEHDGFDLASTTRIDAPALEYLHIEDEVTKDYFLGDFGALVDEANLNVNTTYDSVLHNRTWCPALDLLNKTCNVERLELLDFTMLAIQKLNSYDIPTFHLMTVLEITCYSTVRCGEAISLNLIIEFLKRSPKLEVLHVKEIMFGLDEEVTLALEQNMPDCLASQLKTIELRCLSFKEDELKVVQYFLKNSRVLKNLKINIKDYDSQKETVEESVLALPRGSSECLIEIGG